MVVCPIIMMELALAVEVAKRFGTTIDILMEMGLEILVVGREEVRAHPTAVRQEKLSLQNRWSCTNADLRKDMTYMILHM